MDSKLFDAILAMDSYNRGYNQGISTLSDTGEIGNATIYRESDVLPGSAGFNAGFYAIAYNTAGSITIAYRGTDENITATAKDVLFGYGVGGGLPETPLVPYQQSLMAFQFYQSVADEQAGITHSDPYTANITVTGHSLGGGLAGLVGATYNQNGILFDNMAFENAAENLASHRQTQLSVGDTVYAGIYNTETTILTEAIKDLPLATFLSSIAIGGVLAAAPVSLGLLNSVYGSTTESAAPSFSGLKTIDVAGEPCGCIGFSTESARRHNPGDDMTI